MALADPFQSRITDLSQRFRPQREWAERRGLFLILAHFLTGAGAGAWLFALPFGFQTGFIVGFGLVALGGIAHLLFLGHPERFWRMAARWGSSWISRGFVGVTLFMIMAFLYLLFLFFGAQETLPARILLAISLLGAAWIMVYKGFVWASSKGIPLWNTPLVPALYIAFALRAGAALLLILAALEATEPSVQPLELIKLWLGVSAAVLVLIYLEVMRGSGVTALRSVTLLVRGRVALPFYGGVVLLGLVVPIALGIVATFSPLALPVLALVGLLSLLGDLSVIYCIARAGLYRPLPA